MSCGNTSLLGCPLLYNFKDGVPPREDADSPTVRTSMSNVIYNSNPTPVFYWRHFFVFCFFESSFRAKASDEASLVDLPKFPHPLIQSFAMALQSLFFIVICSLLARFSNSSEVVDLDNSNFEHLTQASTGHTTGDWLVKVYF